jgi:hypothetical protein
MKTLESLHAIEAPTEGYSGLVLSAAKEIRQLRHTAKHLVPTDDPMLDPEFFLASISEGWKPRVIAVHQSGWIVGVIYAKERTISGVSTGIILMDGSLGGFYLGDPAHRHAAFEVAMDIFSASSIIRCVRLRVPVGSEDIDAVRHLTLGGSRQAQYSRIQHNESSLWKYHAHLPLAPTYLEFLNALGKTTRHNFRYYRKRFALAGHQFIENIPIDILKVAALELDPKSKFAERKPQYEIERDLGMVMASSRPLAMGLQHHDGRWLSVLGGWYRPDGAVLCFQRNNDLEFSLDSLSVVLRGYLIERLIEQGFRELVVWGDTGPPLSRYVQYPPTIAIRFDAPSYPWRAARSLMGLVGPLLPRRLAHTAELFS